MAPVPPLERTRDRRPLLAIAWGATVVWLLIALLVFFGMTGGEADLDPLRVMMVPVAVFGPVAIVWVAALNAIRLAEIRTVLAALGGGSGEDLSRKLDAVLKAQREIEGALRAGARTPPAAPRPADARPPEPPEPPQPPRPPQPAEPPRPPEPARPPKTAGPDRPAASPEKSGAATASERPPAETSSDPAGPRQPPGSASPAPEATGAEAPEPADTGILIAALQFPADPDDQEGFRAMRRALRHPQSKQIVTAAQDVLTLLSQDGIYMDDFALGEVPPPLLRRVATGERGAGVADAAALSDPAAEGRIAERMTSDPIFRDATDHFLRHFDRLLADLEPRAGDDELAALAHTRTGRAYLLIGRAMGSFA